MIVLGIETSCDETGVALYDSARGLLAHDLYSQIDLHLEYGGVVPELASRDHIRKLLPMIKQLLNQVQCDAKSISGVAYTEGPGLIGALLVGAAVARSLGFGWNVPTVGVHHMEGHLLAPMLEPNAPAFPFLALLVSGGHTLLVEVDKIGSYKILGESLDDAVGEAFDKTAKLLGLGYHPGGPVVAALAEKGDPKRFRFPRPMTDRPGLDFSFSGLKTFTAQTFQKTQQTEQDKADVARAFEDAVVDTLLIKCRRALQQTGMQRLVVAGGVSANQRLRARLNSLTSELNIEVYYPRHEFCTDNGAMIAYVGYLRIASGQVDPLIIRAKPRWAMTDLS